MEEEAPNLLENLDALLAGIGGPGGEGKAEEEEERSSNESAEGGGTPQPAARRRRYQTIPNQDSTFVPVDVRQRAKALLEHHSAALAAGCLPELANTSGQLLGLVGEEYPRQQLGEWRAALMDAALGGMAVVLEQGDPAASSGQFERFLQQAERLHPWGAGQAAYRSRLALRWASQRALQRAYDVLQQLLAQHAQHDPSADPSAPTPSSDPHGGGEESLSNGVTPTAVPPRRGRPRRKTPALPPGSTAQMNTPKQRRLSAIGDGGGEGSGGKLSAVDPAEGGPRGDPRGDVPSAAQRASWLRHLGQIRLAQWWEAVAAAAAPPEGQTPGSSAGADPYPPGAFWGAEGGSSPFAHADRDAQDRLGEAAGHLEAARQLTPGCPLAALRLAQVYGVSGRVNDALQLAQSCLTTHQRLQLQQPGNSSPVPHPGRQETHPAADELAAVGCFVLAQLGSAHAQHAPHAMRGLLDWLRAHPGDGAALALLLSLHRKQQAGAADWVGLGPVAEACLLHLAARQQLQSQQLQQQQLQQLQQQRGSEGADGSRSGAAGCSPLSRLYTEAARWEYFAPDPPFGGGGEAPAAPSTAAVWGALLEMLRQAAADAASPAAGEYGDGTEAGLPAVAQGREEGAGLAEVLRVLRGSVMRWAALFRKGCYPSRRAEEEAGTRQQKQQEQPCPAEVAVGVLLLCREPGPAEERSREVRQAADAVQSLPEAVSRACRELGSHVAVAQCEREGTLAGLPWAWWQAFPAMARARRALHRVRTGVG